MADQEYEPKLPLWYYDIYPNGQRTGFYHNLGSHAVNYVDRGSRRLVVTFDNLAEAGGRQYDRDAWAAKFVSKTDGTIWVLWPLVRRDFAMQSLSDCLRD